MQVANFYVKDETAKLDKEDFMFELARGYLSIEIMKKKELLEGYLKAYSDMEDKNTFNGEYLSILIEVLKAEIEEETRNQRPQF